LPLNISLPLQLSMYEIVKRLTGELRSGDVVAIMSNGAFGGIHEKFLAALRGAGNPA